MREEGGVKCDTKTESRSYGQRSSRRRAAAGVVIRRCVITTRALHRESHISARARDRKTTGGHKKPMDAWGRSEGEWGGGGRGRRGRGKYFTRSIWIYSLRGHLLECFCIRALSWSSVTHLCTRLRSDSEREQCSIGRAFSLLLKQTIAYMPRWITGVDIRGILPDTRYVRLGVPRLGFVISFSSRALLLNSFINFCFGI
jgi:hypothetical protein